MISFNNDPALKRAMIEKLQWHSDQDDFIQGDWLRKELTNEKGQFKGCQMGCLAQSGYDPIPEVSETYQLDLWYIHLCENIFEGLSVEESKKWPLLSAEVVPVGFEFDWAKSLFHSKVLTDQLRFVESGSEQEKAIKQCIELFNVPFSKISESAARSAESAAESAAGSAARSAAGKEYYTFLRDTLIESIKESIEKPYYKH